MRWFCSPLVMFIIGILYPRQSNSSALHLYFQFFFLKVMELERSKKKKYQKLRELSPPPPAPTLDELEKRFTDAEKRKPSTSWVEKGVAKEIVNVDLPVDGKGVAKSEDKLDCTISTHISYTDSKEINNGTEKFVFPNMSEEIRFNMLRSY